MATTRNRMPDLSASLNEQTSCAPLSDLWNMPKSKLFPGQPGHGPAQAPAVHPAVAQHPPKHPVGGAVSSVGSQPVSVSQLPAAPGSAPRSAPHSAPHSALDDISVLTQPISDLSLGKGQSSTVPYGTIWGEGKASAAAVPGVAHTVPVVPHAVPVVPHAAHGAPSAPRSSGSGIWGSEYPRYHSPSVAAFAQPPFLKGSTPAAPRSPARSLESSWDRSAFLGSPQAAPVASPQAASAPGASVPGVGVPGVGVPGVPGVGVSSVPGHPGHPGHSTHAHAHAPSAAPAASSPPSASLQASLLQQQAQNQAQAHRAQKKGTRPSTNTELYKTELCASYMSTGGNCPYGEKCQFAHGTQELKTVDRPPKWRSKPCQNWVKTGTCSYNERCCFRHDVQPA